jgi:hypothetical protein
VTEFRYRPAPIAAHQRIDPDADPLILRDDSGAEKWRMDWNRIDRAYYVEHPMKGVYMRRLDLIGGDPVKRHSVACTSPSGLPPEGSDGALYLQLVAKILDRLAAERPDFAVRLGEYGASRWVMLAIGVLSAVAGLGIFGLALATGISADRLIGAAVPTLLMAAIGVSLIWAYAPWRAHHRSPATKLAGGLRAIVEAGKRAGDQG